MNTNMSHAFGNILFEQKLMILLRLISINKIVITKIILSRNEHFKKRKNFEEILFKIHSFFIFNIFQRFFVVSSEQNKLTLSFIILCGFFFFL